MCENCNEYKNSEITTVAEEIWFDNTFDEETKKRIWNVIKSKIMQSFPFV